MTKFITRIFAGALIGAAFALACVLAVTATYTFGEHLARLTADESTFHTALAFVEIFAIIGGAIAAFVSYILWSDASETARIAEGRKSWSELFVLWFRG